MAVVTPLNNFLGPEGDTVTVDEQLLNTESRGRDRARVSVLIESSSHRGLRSLGREMVSTVVVALGKGAACSPCVFLHVDM